jgi:hypothetical protein
MISERLCYALAPRSYTYTDTPVTIIRGTVLIVNRPLDDEVPSSLGPGSGTEIGGIPILYQN